MKTSVILFVAGLAVAKSAGTTMRGLEMNTLQFDPFPGTGNINVTCSEIGHNITAGQTYGTSFCRDNSLTVVAGRHSSDAMAIGFKNAVEAMMTTNWGGSGQHCVSPSQLNFYVEVNVTFTQVSTEDRRTHTLWIGQGHYGDNGGNNWWIGGPRCFLNPNAAACGIKCDNEDGQIVLFDREDENSRVDVTLP